MYSFVVEIRNYVGWALLNGGISYSALSPKVDLGDSDIAHCNLSIKPLSNALLSPIVQAIEHFWEQGLFQGVCSCLLISSLLYPLHFHLLISSTSSSLHLLIPPPPHPFTSSSSPPHPSTSTSSYPPPPHPHHLPFPPPPQPSISPSLHLLIPSTSQPTPPPQIPSDYITPVNQKQEVHPEASPIRNGDITHPHRVSLQSAKPSTYPCLCVGACVSEVLVINDQHTLPCLWFFPSLLSPSSSLLLPPLPPPPPPPPPFLRA